MKKILLLLVLGVGCFQFTKAQNHCATMDFYQKCLEKNPQIIENRQALEWLTENYIDNKKKETTHKILETNTLPVVVHVVWQNEIENISDEQIWSQIEVLNQDFRRMNADTINIPAEFAALSADCNIEFCLATVDPEGKPTDGITRTQTNFTNIGTATVSDTLSTTQRIYYTTLGGKSAWNSNQYINIWVGQMGDNLLGYASLPEIGSPLEEGMVISYQFFGNMGTATAPYNGGRTATHEMGHFLNLYHVWGPTSGGCSEDDFVPDTPKQSAPNYNCPIYPQTSCGSSDMFMNYMDYVNDDCMNMFTNDQNNRMEATLNTTRAALLSSKACSEPLAIVNSECFTFIANDLPMAIAPAETTVGLTTSVIEVTHDALITDVNVLTISGLHTTIYDLDVVLENPQGEYVLLVSEACGNENDFSMGFDDEGLAMALPCPPISTEMYNAQQYLNRLDGKTSAGLWKLNIVDYGATNEGLLDEWRLEICTEVNQLRAYIKVFLEGGFDPITGLMDTALVTANLLPVISPYLTSPWLIETNDTLITMPNGVVDWVIVELRDANNDMLKLTETIGFILADGSLVHTDGSLGVAFQGVPNNSSYYVVVRHRNHLDVMSELPLLLPNTPETVYDFTNPTTVLNGLEQLAQVDSCCYALHAGDFNGDGVITVNDYNNYANETASVNVYKSGDFNLNGSVTVSDFNIYQPNASRIGVAQVRFNE